MEVLELTTQPDANGRAHSLRVAFDGSTIYIEAERSVGREGVWCALADGVAVVIGAGKRSPYFVPLDWAAKEITIFKPHAAALRTKIEEVLRAEGLLA